MDRREATGRRGPARAVAIGFVASVVLALTVGASLLPAGGAPRNPKANRFGPSGVVTVDPVASREQAARMRAQASTAAGVAVSNRRIVVTFGSYINRHSSPQRGNCTRPGSRPPPA